MSRFSAIVIFGAVCLLMAGTANAQDPFPPTAPYTYFSTGTTYTTPTGGGGTSTAIVGFDKVDDSGMFQDPTTVSVTFTTDSSWLSQMNVYNGSTVNVSGGDSSDLEHHPGGNIGGALVLESQGMATLNDNGTIQQVILEGQNSSFTMNGGNAGSFANGQFLGGVSVTNFDNVTINSGNITNVGASFGTVIIAGGTVLASCEALYEGTITLSGSNASINGDLTGNAASTINIKSGTVYGNLTVNESTATIDAGTIKQGISCLDSSTVNINSGTIGGDLFSGQPNSTINMSAGSVSGSATATGNGSIELTGGTIGGNLAAVSNGDIWDQGAQVTGNASENGAYLEIDDGTIGGNVSALDGNLIINGGFITGTVSCQGHAIASVGSSGGHAVISQFSQTGNSTVELGGDTVVGGTYAMSGKTTFTLRGGNINTISAQGTGTLNLIDGTVSGSLFVTDACTVNLSGDAEIDSGLNAHGGSTINVSGGTIFGGLNAYDGSTVNYSGGLILGGLNLFGGAKAIYVGDSPAGGPNVRPLVQPATGASQLPVIYLHDNASLEVDGIHLSASLIDPSNDNGMYSEYQLSGLFGDGSSIPSGLQFFVENTTGGAAAPTFTLMGTAQKWTPAGGGTWISTANWTPAILPNGPGDFADFSGVTAPATVTLDGDRTVGQLNINNSNNAVTIAQGSGGSLILNNHGSDAVINIAGNEQIIAPVIGQDNTDVVAVANSSLVFAGGITMAGGKTLTVKSTGAPGTLSIPTGSTINGNLVSNASSINIAGGTVNGNLSVLGAGTITMTSGNVQGNLELDNDSVTTINGGSISLGLSGITVNEKAKFIWSGGMITGSGAGNQAPIYLNDNSSLMMSGFGLNALLLDPNNDGGMYSEYQLTGALSDGTPISSGVELFVLNPAGDADPPTFTLTNTPQKWATAGGGSWSSAGNWLPAVAPNVSGSIANLANASTTITLDGDRTVGTLQMQGSHSFDIAQGSGGTLYLNNNGSDAAINVAGNHQILAPVVAQDNTDITIAANGSLSLADGIGSAAGKTVTLTSSSAGALTISGSATIGGDLVANGGSLDMEGGTVNGKLTAAGSSNVTLNDGNVQGGLLLQGNALVTMNGGTVSGMTGHGISELDLEDGEIDGDVNAYDNSNVFFDGGVIVGNINVYNSAFVDVFTDYPASSTGPDIKAVRPLTAPSPSNSIYVHDSASVELDGINLSAALLDAHNDNGMYSEYQLSGYYPDGTLIPSGVDFFIQNGSGATFQLLGSGQEWNAGASGSWGAAANWLPAIVADGPAQGAGFESSSAPATITLDGDRTLGAISMLGGESFTIVPGSGGTLTLNDLGFGADIQTSGHQFINAPVIAQDNTQIDVSYDPSLGQSDNGLLTMSDGITVSAGKTLTKVDVGTLSVAFIRGGTLDIDGGTVSMISNGTSAGASKLEGLSINTSNGAALDLANNDVLVNNSTLGEIVPLIQSGFANGKWNGPGIISSSATAIRGLGVLTGAQFLAMHPGQQFDGNTVAATDVLIKYTLYGDSNLDGIVNASDYQAIDNGFNMRLGDWADGDFNYDGVVNGDDYTLIDNAFNSQGSVSPGAEGVPAEMIASDTEQLAAVPEPASAGMIFVGAAALLRRRRFI